MRQRTLGESEAQEQFGNLFTRVLNENAQLPAHVIATARDALRILHGVLSAQSVAGYWDHRCAKPTHASVDVAKILAETRKAQFQAAEDGLELLNNALTLVDAVKE